MRSCWPAGSRATGASRTGCTTSATSPKVKTPRASAPAPAPKSWPSCATQRSTCIGWRDTPTSPAPHAGPAGEPAAPTPASPRHDHELFEQVNRPIPDFASTLIEPPVAPRPHTGDVTAASFPGEAGALGEVGAGGQRGDEPGDLQGVSGAVSVEHDHDVAGRLGEAAGHCVALAAPVLKDDAHV